MHPLAPEASCLYCGNPLADHIPVRYTIRVWLMHLLPAWACRQLRTPRTTRWPSIF